jgi:hypothetical protein
MGSKTHGEAQQKKHEAGLAVRHLDDLDARFSCVEQASVRDVRNTKIRNQYENFSRLRLSGFSAEMLRDLECLSCGPFTREL